MTEPLLGAPGSASAAPGTAVTLSSAALRANLLLARAEGATDADGDVLLADAWGHGSAWVREILADEGIDDAASRRLSGTALYGLATERDDIRPVMRMSGRVLSTKLLRRGEGVSYGYRYRAEADTRVALVTGGYAQGIVRALGNRIDAAVGGSRCPVIGRVAMDACVVEIGGLAVARGDEAVFFGDERAGEPSITQWAAATGMSVAELVTAVGLRVPRSVA